MVQRAFGASGDKLVAMELLEGEEASIFGFSDGENIVCVVPSQDHKTIGEGDVGLNTGGMGAYSPAPVITPELFDDIVQRIMKRTIHALAQEGRPYKGILYGGIIVTADGPKVIEFNCRMGRSGNAGGSPVDQNRSRGYNRGCVQWFGGRSRY